MKRALTLVEVMLALGILAVGILTGVELMARVVAAQSPQNTWSTWEPRVMQARQRVEAMSYADVNAQLLLGEISFNDLNVSIAAAANENDNPHPESSRSLVLKVKDTNGSVAATLPMLKIKETQ